MKLLADARREAGVSQRALLGLRGEGDMHGRGAARLAQRAQRRDQRLARARRGVLRHEQPPTRHRRERHGDLNLGIIAAAHLLKGPRPILIEHIFAEAMRFEIGGRRGDQPSIRILDERMSGRPARAGADRFRSFQREQECARNKRIVSFASGFRLAQSSGIGACVPGLRVDESERRCDAYFEGGGGHGDRDDGKRERSCLLSRKRDARDVDRHANSPPPSNSKPRATDAAGS